MRLCDWLNLWMSYLWAVSRYKVRQKVWESGFPSVESGEAAHTRVDPGPPPLIAGNAPPIAHHHTRDYPTEPRYTWTVKKEHLFKCKLCGKHFQYVIWAHRSRRSAKISIPHQATTVWNQMTLLIKYSSLYKWHMSEKQMKPQNSKYWKANLRLHWFLCNPPPSPPPSMMVAPSSSPSRSSSWK